MQPWLWLTLAIFFEVTGTVNLKLSNGLTKVIPSILVVVFYLCSFACLAITLKKMEVGTAYAIWAGLGTSLIALVGILYFHESVSILKVISIILIVLGVVGLNLVNAVHS